MIKQKQLVILISNKILDRITKVSKALPHYHSETITNQDNKEIAKEKCISLEGRQKIIDELRLIGQCNNGISKNYKFVRQNTNLNI